MKYLITVQICSSCTKKNTDFESSEDFQKLIQNKLQDVRPDFDWNVEGSPCMRVCPTARITMNVSSSKRPDDIRMTLSREANLDSVVKEVLSFFPPLQN